MFVTKFVFKIGRQRKCSKKLHFIPSFSNIREQDNLPKSPLEFTTKRSHKKEYPLMATLQLTDSQQATLSVAYADKRGNPVPAPAGAQPPTWMVDNSAILTLTPAADGMSCVIAAVGPLGTAKVSVAATDAAGNALAGGGIDVPIVSGAPSTLNITGGTPSEQP